MANIFTISAFFIVLREVLEACLVVGIVLAYLQKTGGTQLRPYVWIGAGAGVLLSLAVGVTFAVIYYKRDDQLFSGRAEYIFEGIAFLFAAALLTWMILWMLAMGKKIRANIEAKVDRALEAESSFNAKLGIITMVFIQVLREGIETFIFLFGAAESDEDKSEAWKGVILPGLLGLVVGLAVAYFVFRGLVTLDIQAFFLLSSVILMAFAAGLVSHGLHELQEADWFGPYKNTDVRDWWNASMWTTKECCNDKTNEFFAMLRALFGYQDTPTFIELTSYFAYWAVILIVVLAMNWAVVSMARNRAAKYTRGLVSFSLVSFFVGFIYACLNATWTGLLTTILGLGLSILATLVAFDVVSGLSAALKKSRRSLALFLAIATGVFGLFVCTLHIAQLSCLEVSCRFPAFYYWGLIFNEPWLEEGNTGSTYNSVAVLGVSFVFSFFFFGIMALALYIFSMHVNSEGDYVYDQCHKGYAVPKDIEEEASHSTPIEDVSS